MVAPGAGNRYIARHDFFAHRTVFRQPLEPEAQGLLEGSFPLIWLQGEISNPARPRSGHIYFSLKDDRAQVNAAMFRNRNSLLRFQPRDGQQILVRARVTVFVPRGGFQIIVEHMEEAGEGALRAQFEALKAKLELRGCSPRNVSAHYRRGPGASG